MHSSSIASGYRVVWSQYLVARGDRSKSTVVLVPTFALFHTFTWTTWTVNVIARTYGYQFSYFTCSEWHASSQYQADRCRGSLSRSKKHTEGLHNEVELVQVGSAGPHRAALYALHAEHRRALGVVGKEAGHSAGRPLGTENESRQGRECIVQELLSSGCANQCTGTRVQRNGVESAPRRTRSRWPTRPPPGRTACRPPAALAPGTTESPRSPCTGRLDPL